MLRVAFFGTSGEMSAQALRSISRRHQVVVAVRPGRRPAKSRVRRTVTAVRKFFRQATPRGIEEIARDLGVPVLQARPGEHGAVVQVLRELSPDIMCIAGYPWILPRTVYGVPRLGAINLHPSLLPRHRGRLPLFWIYYHDDREAGVTVHSVTEEVDAGDVILQDHFPLPRGFSVEELGEMIAHRGAAVLLEALDAIADGVDSRVPQDDTLCSAAPMIKPGQAYTNFEEWDVERVWHFLSGLVTRFREPLADEKGTSVSYERVTGYRRVDHQCRPGSMRRLGSQIDLFCRGGIVDLELGSSDQGHVDR